MRTREEMPKMNFVIMRLFIILIISFLMGGCSDNGMYMVCRMFLALFTLRLLFFPSGLEISIEFVR